MTLSEADLLSQIIAAYPVGKLTGYTKLTRGYVNISYAVTAARGEKSVQYLLRIYRRGIGEDEIKFEHSIIRHLMNRHFDLTAGAVASKTGATYLPLPGDGELFCALFVYLPGKDKYSWIRPRCTPGEIAESAATLAHFHDAVWGLTPDGRRSEPKIIDLLPLIEARIPARLEKRGSSKFEDVLADNQAFIVGAIRRARAGLDPAEVNATPQLVIHGDYHPGNLKFDHGKVVGLFDLDWSKIDARTFDLGLALTYFCASWDARHVDNYFQLDRAETFLKAYQSALDKGSGLSPLDAVEIKYVPVMIPAGNIYVLEWALRDFYGGGVNPVEYLGYLQHHLCLMHWFEDEDNREKLEQMIGAAVSI